MWARLGSFAPACGPPRIYPTGFRGDTEEGMSCGAWRGSRVWKELRSGVDERYGLFGGTRGQCFGLRYGGAVDGLMGFRDAGATVGVMVGAYALVRAFDVLSERKIVEQKVSRKAVHILSGILFMTSWPIFSSSNEARIFASLVPLLNGIRLIIYGFSLVKNEGLIKSVTREGKPEELLKGPLYYVIVLMFCSLVFWRNSPVGIIALSMMSGGDGFADIMGRRYGQSKLPYNRHKSWVGSICMFASGFSLSMGMLYYFSSLGYLELEWEQVANKVALVSLAATAVESLPITNIVDDNMSVPLCCILVASLLFGF